MPRKVSTGQVTFKDECYRWRSFLCCWSVQIVFLLTILISIVVALKWQVTLAHFPGICGQSGPRGGALGAMGEP